MAESPPPLGGKSHTICSDNIGPNGSELTTPTPTPMAIAATESPRVAFGSGSNDGNFIAIGPVGIFVNAAIAMMENPAATIATIATNQSGSTEHVVLMLDVLPLQS